MNGYYLQHKFSPHSPRVNSFVNCPAYLLLVNQPQSVYFCLHVFAVSNGKKLFLTLIK